MNTNMPMNTNHIDLNADVAEGCEQDEALLSIVSSANICCGLHAGSYREMLSTLKLAKDNNVRVGAHPGFDDKDNFGRLYQPLDTEAYRALLSYQLGATKALCDLIGVKLSYVKPHGALYNHAATDKALADIIASEVLRFDPHLSIMGLSGSQLIASATQHGLGTISEVFADRRYNNDGTLVSRTQPNALISDIQQAIDQVLEMITEGVVTSIDGKKIPVSAQSVCLHGDSANALNFASQLKSQLKNQGICISS